MFDAILEMLSAWGPIGRNPWTAGAQNSMDAYMAAWARRRGRSDSVELLVAELKAHNVPGAYTRPESRAELFLWFDSWEHQRTPDEVREILRSRYERQRRK